MKMINYKNSGFTLLEIILAMGIFIVVAGLAYSFVHTNYQAANFGHEQNEAIESARKGIETMVEEIRESGQSAQGGYIILEDQPQSLKFYSDVDKDGIKEQVHYWLDGSNFKKGIIKPTADGQYLDTDETSAILSQYVRNGSKAVFIYYDADYPVNMANNPLLYEAASISSIRLIDTYLEINVDITRAPDSYILESKANIRTLKDNL